MGTPAPPCARIARLNRSCLGRDLRATAHPHRRHRQQRRRNQRPRRPRNGPQQLAQPTAAAREPHPDHPLVPRHREQHPDARPGDRRAGWQASPRAAEGHTRGAERLRGLRGPRRPRSDLHRRPAGSPSAHDRGARQGRRALPQRQRRRVQWGQAHPPRNARPLRAGGDGPALRVAAHLAPTPAREVVRVPLRVRVHPPVLGWQRPHGAALALAHPAKVAAAVRVASDRTVRPGASAGVLRRPRPLRCCRRGNCVRRVHAWGHR